MTYKQLLKEGVKLTDQYQKEEHAAKVLLMHYSAMEPSQFYLAQGDDVSPDVQRNYLTAIEMHCVKHVPIQHIMGYDYFFGHKFTVNEDVLIPRFETEELVENILLTYDTLFEGKEVDVLDLGTGSGCIGVTLALEESAMKVSASDISDKALAVAKKNARDLGANVTFYQGDLFEPLKGKSFDILVSNPPYIPAEEYVEPLVKDHEPHVALFGGMDGMAFYRRILTEAKAFLKPTHFIAFEHAHDKGEAMLALAKEHFPHSECKVLKDMQGKDRMTFIITKEESR